MTSDEPFHGLFVHHVGAIVADSFEGAAWVALVDEVVSPDSYGSTFEPECVLVPIMPGISGAFELQWQITGPIPGSAPTPFESCGLHLVPMEELLG